ncbi:MAG TPA: hypothetical protein VGF67_02045 [Ktedonobacteraceae bacterium]|jgi:hypothetical protein
MRDPDHEYPRHQPGREEHSHHDPFAIQEEGELEEPGRRERLHQREAATTPQLPARHASKALITGVVLGALVSVQGVILTLNNAQIYKQVAQYTQTSVPLGLATSLLWISLLSLGISAVIYFLGGLVIGKISVHRRWAFIGGCLGGLVSSAVGAVLKQIPAYPNASNTGFSGGLLGLGGGLVALLVGIILLCVLAGLTTLLGGWLITRHHPYYVGYYG